MWKAIVLVTTTTAFVLIGVLAAWVGRFTGPELFGTVLAFGIAGFVLAALAIRGGDRDWL